MARDGPNPEHGLAGTRTGAVRNGKLLGMVARHDILKLAVDKVTR